MSCREIYATLGALFFRKAEEEVVASLAGITGAIISLGGGTILSLENRRILSRLGKLVCLFIEKEQIMARWNITSPLGSDLEQLFHERMEAYRTISCIWVRAKETNLLEILERIFGGK